MRAFNSAATAAGISGPGIDRLFQFDNDLALRPRTLPPSSLCPSLSLSLLGSVESFRLTTHGRLGTVFAFALHSLSLSDQRDKTFP